jgi:hypothetical protein
MLRWISVEKNIKVRTNKVVDYLKRKCVLHLEMKRRGVLAETTNWLRLLSYFRAELSKRCVLYTFTFS